MRSRVRFFGHPLHAILVALPLAAFPLILVLDVLWWWTGRAMLWGIGWWIAVIAGAVGLVAAVPGFVDLLAIPSDRREARRKCVRHMAVGVLLVVLLAATAALRLWAVAPGSAWVWAVDIVGVGVAGVQGYLGGELVYRHHVGVPEMSEGARPVPPTEPPRPAAPTRYEE